MFLPRLISLLTEPISLLLSLTPLRRLLQRQDHFAPHAGAPFEGYYTRIVTASGATVLLIFSSVFGAAHKPHYLHFSYLPPSGTTSSSSSTSAKAVTINRFPDISNVLLGMRDRDSGGQGFKRVARGDGVSGEYVVDSTSGGGGGARYSLTIDADGKDDGGGGEEGGRLGVEVSINGRTPWRKGEPLSTPEGVFSRLVFLLPLHWNVWSTASQAHVCIRKGGEVLEEGSGIAHVEKNWGVSFPRGWTWIQGFSPSPPSTSTPSTPSSTLNMPAATFSLAGGKILGQKAYLLGYRSISRQWSFAPPYSLLPFSSSTLTPFISETHDSRRGTFSLSVVSGLWRKMVVQAAAPPNHEGWVGMACPLANGHGNTLAYETFEGVVSVGCFERSWLKGWVGPWRLVEETLFEKAAVEFGGEYSFMCK